jgi:hypothetical protein
VLIFRPKEVKEKTKLPTGDQLIRLIEALLEPCSTMVYLVSVSSIRRRNWCSKWDDLKAEEKNLWIVRAMNKGKSGHLTTIAKGFQAARGRAGLDKKLVLYSFSEAHLHHGKGW